MKRILIFIGLSLMAQSLWANQLKGLRVAPSAEKTRIVFDMTEKPQYSYTLTEASAQLVVDLQSITGVLSNPELQRKLGPVIKSVRRAAPPVPGGLRLVFELAQSTKPTVFTLRPQQQYGHRLVIDLSHGGSPITASVRSGVSSASAGSQNLAERSGKAVAPVVSSVGKPLTSSTAQRSDKPVAGRIIAMSDEPAIRNSGGVQIKEETLSTQVRTVGSKPAGEPQRSASTSSTTSPLSVAKPAADSRIKPYQTDAQPPAALAPRSATPVAKGGDGTVVIAIDAGHGGKDPGAIGQNGTYEKHVTLAVARELSAMINRQPGMRAVMTRTGDYFVDLDARSEIARRHKAQLLVSIHADSVENGTARGASVWILSNKRVDREMNKLLGQQDKHTQLLGGAGKVIAEAEPNPYLAQTILDLSWDNSRSEGYSIGENVLRQMGRVARLHKNKPVHASLAVLKAPDIPSLLIETGFISNAQEERLLASRNYQSQLAKAIFTGMKGYYADNPPEGSLLASRSSGSPQPAAATKSSVRHVVKTGDSLSQLAQRYGVSKQRLKSHNSLNSDVLRIGQVLYIPTS
ncbi:MAG: N-acetylmuramoyl-L-alanine amidase [Aeromonadaceae bacterium]